METVYQLAVWLHVVFGTLVLIFFWLQAILSKGSRRHVIVGKMFVASGVLVATSALYSFFHQLIATLMRGERVYISDSDFTFALILAFIAIEVLIMLHRGQVSARRAQASIPHTVRGFYIRFAVSLLATAGMAFLIFGGNDAWQLPLLAATILGAKLTLDELYVLRRHQGFQKGDWTAEHFRGMIGAGIAFHVAFGINGVIRLDSISAEALNVGIFIAAVPVVIGVPAEVFLRRRYKSMNANQGKSIRASR